MTGDGTAGGSLPAARGQSTAQLLAEHFRCPDDFGNFLTSRELSPEPGYFRLGPGVICYGQCSSGVPARSAADTLHNAFPDIGVTASSVHLPFDPVQVVDNLQYERYSGLTGAAKPVLGNPVVRRLYYLLRPLLPVPVRKHLQKVYLRGWDKIPFPQWPVDVTVERILDELLLLSMKSRSVEKVPFIWFWPEGAPSCTIMTHDVETAAGRDFCRQLMDLDASFGIRSSFQIVPEERYAVSESFLELIRERGFEVNVHDLAHNGSLASHREEFLRHASRINRYGKQFGALGFRAALMYRNADWYDALDFSYDMSIPNVAHLEPQRGGCCRVFPFFIGRVLELPLTTTQDYSLFHILADYSTRLWREQVQRIRERNGLISFIVHPDYNIDRKARRVYAELLEFLSDLRAQGETWIALPKDVVAWWRLRRQLKLVHSGGSWRIEGEGKERARLAYAVMAGEKLSYELA